MEANVLDASNTVFLCMLLIVFALVTKDVNGVLLAQICVAIVVGAFFGIIVPVVWGLYERFVRSGKPYQFFICHHKARAGNFTRLLKMVLLTTDKVSRKIFVDSDDLRDLGTLLGTVSSDTETLCVLCSKEILLRPWCTGEVSTAYANNVDVQTVLFPGFDFPEDAFLEHYEEHVPDANMLSGHGIGLDLLKTALRTPLTVNILLAAAKQDIAVLPVVSESSFRFPTPQYLAEIAGVADDMLKQIDSEYSGDHFARVVKRIFKEIAVELNPQDAESALKMQSQVIRQRLKGGLRKLGVDLKMTDDGWLRDAVDKGSAELIWDVPDLENYLALTRPSRTAAVHGPRIGPSPH